MKKESFLRKNHKLLVHLEEAIEKKILEQKEESEDKKNNEQDSNYIRAKAFTSVAKDLLGLSDDKTAFETDGAGDRGIDCYKLGDGFAQVYQFKGRNSNIKEASKSSASPDMIKDVGRIVDYIKNIETPQTEQNSHLKIFQQGIQHKIRSYYKSREDEIDTEDNRYKIEINLILMANGLTDQCSEEFESLKKSNGKIPWRENEIDLQYNLIFINELLEKSWSIDNTVWKNRDGDKCEKIQLETMPSDLSDSKEKIAIHNKNFIVAFVNAIDLVKAYEDLGYQIFQHNVRCQIKKSKVNSRIREQVNSEKGIKEFHTLNNGVTIIVQNPSIRYGDNKSIITLLKPGIINGLQTITSLAEAYSKMDGSLKEKFEKHCYVLVRIFREKTSLDSSKMVLATNTQNLMEDRNLRSNEQIQIDLEKSFFKIDPPWFYERKEGTWEAFKDSGRNWPTLPNARPQNFSIGNKRRRANNQYVAESWLAFIGYPSHAMNDKKQIFSSDKNFYEGIFQMYPKKHGADVDFENFNKNNFDGGKEPTHYALLFSFLLHQLSKSLPHSNKQAETKIASDLKKNITQKKEPHESSKEKKKHDLLTHPGYLKTYLLNSANYLFIDIVGYILFKRYGDNLHSVFPTLLKESDMSDMYRNLDNSKILKTFEENEFNERSSIAMCWAIFNKLIEILVDEHGEWVEEYRAGSVSRKRLLSNPKTRNIFIKKINTWVEIASKRSLHELWSDYIDKEKDFYKGIFPFEP